MNHAGKGLEDSPRQKERKEAQDSRKRKTSMPEKQQVDNSSTGQSWPGSVL